MNYSTTVTRLQRHHHHDTDNFLKLIFNMFSETYLLYIWILIHATWTVSYKLE